MLTFIVSALASLALILGASAPTQAPTQALTEAPTQAIAQPIQAPITAPIQPLTYTAPTITTQPAPTPTITAPTQAAQATITAPTQATTQAPAQATTQPTAAPLCYEDMPCWNCATMGNLICGTAPVTAPVTAPANCASLGLLTAEDYSCVPPSFYDAPVADTPTAAVCPELALGEAKAGYMLNCSTGYNG